MKTVIAHGPNMKQALINAGQEECADWIREVCKHHRLCISKKPDYSKCKRYKFTIERTKMKGREHGRK